MDRGGSESQKPDHTLHDPCSPQEGGWISFGTIGSNWQIFGKGMVWSNYVLRSSAWLLYMVTVEEQ